MGRLGRTGNDVHHRRQRSTAHLSCTGCKQQAGVLARPADRHGSRQLRTPVGRCQEPADRRHQGKQRRWYCRPHARQARHQGADHRRHSEGRQVVQHTYRQGCRHHQGRNRDGRQGQLRGGKRCSGPLRQAGRRRIRRPCRRNENAVRQHFRGRSRVAYPQPRPRRSRRGDGFEEDQVHFHRRNRCATGDAQGCGQVQGSIAHLRQDPARPPGQRPRPADLRHRRAGEHPQRSRRPADPQLHQRPVRRARQDFRRDHARHHRRARRQCRPTAATPVA